MGAGRTGEPDSLFVGSLQPAIQAAIDTTLDGLNLRFSASGKFYFQGAFYHGYFPCDRVRLN